MLFPTLAFHVFFIAVFAGNWALRRAGDWRLIVLLVASWIFYGWMDARFVLLLIVSSLFNWAIGRVILAVPRLARAWLIFGVIVNLVALAYCKYDEFLIGGANALFARLGLSVSLPTTEVLVSIGVSFFTFQAISYIADVYARRSAPARLLELSLLMSFFPHLAAGPIVRPGHILPQLRENPGLSRGVAATSLVLIGWGLVKKVVIANELALHLVDPVFNDPAAHGATDLVVAAYGYAIQIYCDFSAYSDMAIGLAGLLGFRFPRNFDQPYRAASFRNFWRRWHISLSSWLTDYLYIGVFGGNRHGVVWTCLAIFATMVLGGLWHGASVNFLIWGALHGGLLVAERLWGMARPAWLPPLPPWLARIGVFHGVTVAWVFFRCTRFDDATAFLRRIAQGQPGDVIASPWTVGMIALGLACQFGPADAIQRLGRGIARLPFGVVALIGTALLLVIEGLRGAGVAPFIYFQF